MSGYKIIVEGPNNVGKSTLINELLTLEPFNKFKVEHVGSKCPNDYDFHEKLLASSGNLILDRFCVGEMIYPKLYVRKQKLTNKQMDELLQNHRNHIALVFVDADVEFIAKAYENKSETPDWRMIYDEREMFYNHYLDIYNRHLCYTYYIKNRLDSLKYKSDFVLDDLKTELCIRYHEFEESIGGKL